MDRRVKKSRKFRHRSGGSLLELCLVLPLLLGISFLSAEYGFAFYVKHTLQGAAREGARAAIVAGASATDVQTAVANEMAAAGFSSSTYNTPTVSPSDWTSDASGTAITVNVTAQWGSIGFDIFPATLLGVPTGAIPSSRQLTGATTMRKEG